MDALEESARKIERAYPQHAERCAALTRRLQDAVAGLPPVPAGPVHGSFKISHVFDAGGRVAFIDFDGAGIGDPTYDVGRFLAHLAVAGLNSKTDGESIEQAVRAFRDAYGQGVPWGWPDERVRWYTAALLLSSQAYKCVKRMVPERVDAILRCAEAWFPQR
jgi:aminoglycoside phosphotransferase (APT) family kinase protein